MKYFSSAGHARSIPFTSNSKLTSLFIVPAEAVPQKENKNGSGRELEVNGTNSTQFNVNDEEPVNAAYTTINIPTTFEPRMKSRSLDENAMPSSGFHQLIPTPLHQDDGLSLAEYPGMGIQHPENLGMGIQHPENLGLTTQCKEYNNDQQLDSHNEDELLSQLQGDNLCIQQLRHGLYTDFTKSKLPKHKLDSVLKYHMSRL
jgi:hypothetical protein